MANDLSAFDPDPKRSTPWLTWTRAAELAAVLGLLIAFVPYLWSDSRKSAVVQIRGASQLLNGSLSSPAGSSLKVDFGGKTVSEPYLLSGRLVNNGTVPISPGDFDQMPVTITFAAAKIITATISDASHPSLRRDFARHSDGQLVLSSVAMNPGDYVEFQALCDGNPGIPTVDWFLLGGTPARIEVEPAASQTYHVFGFSMPRWAEWGALSVVSFVGSLFPIFFVMFILDEIKQKQRIWDSDALRKVYYKEMGDVRIDKLSVGAIFPAIHRKTYENAIRKVLESANRKDLFPMVDSHVASLDKLTAGEVGVWVRELFSNNIKFMGLAKYKKFEWGPFITVAFICSVWFLVVLLIIGSWRTMLTW